ncbi:MAG: hypothetical protein WC843_03865 [Candidatus Gracilibacteria bacterium]
MHVQDFVFADFTVKSEFRLGLKCAFFLLLIDDRDVNKQTVGTIKTIHLQQGFVLKSGNYLHASVAKLFLASMAGYLFF